MSDTWTFIVISPVKTSKHSMNIVSLHTKTNFMILVWLTNPDSYILPNNLAGVLFLKSQTWIQCLCEQISAYLMQQIPFFFNETMSILVRLVFWVVCTSIHMQFYIIDSICKTKNIILTQRSTYYLSFHPLQSLIVVLAQLETIKLYRICSLQWNLRAESTSEE